MKVDNTTTEDVVYQAKDGTGGGIPHPILAFLEEGNQVYNDLGCAGGLHRCTLTTFPAQIKTHNPVVLTIYKLVEIPLEGEGLKPTELKPDDTYKIRWKDVNSKDILVVYK